MSKTPYEIRLELLKLAKDSLFEPVYQKRQIIMDEYMAKREIYPGQEPPTTPVPFPTMPGFPDTDSIIAEAEKLNKFISQ
jgi:hypothetical protein